jgi:hypothetical protein
LQDDPFCRDDVVKVGDIMATSAHAAAIAVAVNTWAAVQISSLEPRTASEHSNATGNPYTRVDATLACRSPTEGEWSPNTWRDVCAGLGRCVEPDKGWFEAALTLERNQLRRRLEERTAKGPAEPGQPKAAKDVDTPSMTSASTSEPVEVARIRNLLDGFVAANERNYLFRVRLLVLPVAEETAAHQLSAGNLRLTVAVPHGSAAEGERPEPPPESDVVIPPAAMDGCSRYEFWGVTQVEKDGIRLGRVIFLVWDGPGADGAAHDFRRLAVESGRLYQTCPPAIAPIGGATSPRNLWAAVLYGWLRGTDWVSSAEGYEAIVLPFAAGVEFWRQLLYAGGRFVGATDPNNVDSVQAGKDTAKRRTRKRAQRAAKIELLVNELTRHLRAARDHAFATKNLTGTPELLPRPSQRELAKWTGLTESDVSRCLKDSRARELRLCWDTAVDLEQLLKWEGKRRPGRPK